jgi:deazaflavin-dependent oxidoreductase (nitroreductase family)
VSEEGDFNGRVIEEFRANGGRVGGMFEGAPIVLLTTTGARTGRRRTTPLMYLPDGDRVLVFATKGGAPTNPDWYHNLVANPDVTIEVGSDTKQATATIITGPERDRLYAEQVARRPQFGDYERRTTRTIPVVALVPKG